MVWLCAWQAPPVLDQLARVRQSIQGAAGLAAAKEAVGVDG